MLRFRMGIGLGSDRHNLGFHCTPRGTVKLPCRGFVPATCTCIAMRTDGGSTRRSQRAPHRPPGWWPHPPPAPPSPGRGWTLARGARPAQAHIRIGWGAGLLAEVWVWVGGGWVAVVARRAQPCPIQPASQPSGTPPDRRPAGTGEAFGRPPLPGCGWPAGRGPGAGADARPPGGSGSRAQPPRCDLGHRWSACAARRRRRSPSKRIGRRAARSRPHVAPGARARAARARV